MNPNLQDLKNCGNLAFQPNTWDMLNEIIEKLEQLREKPIKGITENVDLMKIADGVYIEIDEILGENQS